MKELILQFLKEYCTEIYDMAESDLDLKMDDHIGISWGGKEYFMPENNSSYTKNDDLIWEFLNTCYHL